MACACDSVSPLPVEEKAIMGTWRVLAVSFFPLPVEETTIMGTRRALANPPTGLRWALQGSVEWNCLSFDRQEEMTITGTCVCVIVHACLFIDWQREKGWSPQGENPPLALGF